MSKKTFKFLSNGTACSVSYKKDIQHLEIHLCFPGSSGQSVVMLNGVTEKDISEIANSISSCIMKNN